MSSKVAKLVGAYREHISVPWAGGLAAIQRVIFAVYDKTDELRLRAHIDEFRLATLEAGHQWLLVDVTNAFPEWMAAQEYRDAYFECPEDLTGYQAGEIVEFVHGLVERIKTTIVTEATPNTVVALMGVGSLFGLARVSSIVEGIKDAVDGRLVVFFPGEYHPENHAYRLLDARDGWNYLAVPLLAKEA
ncbi:BREX protein BrxB domain-containing protein [Thauera phenolivorans]|uniref:BREX protein BrxB domain-containing protein n=1 Tax=Thauera phenolivorans TaxID=1792543 RepID=UPI000839E08F|nr:BREX protein BrxB domain-containing protein [Thauera phenolivorans]